ncbi:RluA family pseudouridine synthase [Candidatus Endowatersipora endosymbiont of Watersipora subatra]|uniref:RluA family pseudouridine synthase n=1 Tax=Candidatus Endowatersipora endosymbiont of Watersipora subatra TaxID=3077946 RepID=UPI00312C7DC1
MSKVMQKVVEEDEAYMRLDRWFKVYCPDLGFGKLQKLLRSGQVRVNGSRVKSSSRLESGQIVRIPPLDTRTITKKNHMTTTKSHRDFDILRDMLLFKDKKVFVFNKPSGLAVQGGSGIQRSIDSMLESLCDKYGNKPRLVHRLDRDTSGTLLVARTRGAAVSLNRSFREGDTQKNYWALIQGMPLQKEGHISTYLSKEKTVDGDRMRVAKNGDCGAYYSISRYRIIDSRSRNVSWVELSPITGRTHQLRVHMAYLGHPIIGDKKYFNSSQWQYPFGIPNRLHLHARRILIPHPDPQVRVIDVTAPLPPHMIQSWNVLSFDKTDSVFDKVKS